MPADIDRLLAKRAVESTLVELVVATGVRTWTGVQQVFADRVHFGMSSLYGRDAETLTPAEITSRRDAGLSRLEAAPHRRGNFRVTVDGNTVAAGCYVIAHQFLPDKASNRVPFWAPANSAWMSTTHAGGSRP